MNAPQFERWVENSRECGEAVEAADEGKQTEAVLALLDAGEYASNSDYPERDRAYREAVKYVEHVFGRTFDVLYEEEFGTPADEEVLRPSLD